MTTKVQAPQSEQRIAGMFDRIAPRYDLLNRLLSMRQDQRWRKKMISMIPYRPSGSYLDVATGTGDVLLACRKRRREYAEFVGVDISEEMLKQARVKAKAERSEAPTEFKRMSAENLDFIDNRFDALTIAFGLRNVVDRERALTEFRRVLKDQGTLLILEFFIPKTGLMGRTFQFYFHKILPFVGGLISDKDAYTYLPQSVGSFYSAEALREALYHVGFTVEDEVNYLFGACRLIRAKRV